MADGVDDRTQSSEIGYQIRFIDGDLPDGMHEEEFAGTFAQGDLVFVWADGATDDQEPFGFILGVSAVDLAGNVGSEIEVDVSDSASGCSITAQRGGWSTVFAFVVLFAAPGRRRQTPICATRSDRSLTTARRIPRSNRSGKGGSSGR